MFNVILPTYNEKENIKPVFYMIRKAFKTLKQDYQIILVDDNSPDGTFEEAQKYRNVLNIKYIKRECKSGLGSAYKAAIKECSEGFVIILDADLSHNPLDIIKMVKKMNIKQLNENVTSSYDIMCGSRYLDVKESGIVGWNFKRKIISRGANNLAKYLLGLKTSDLTSSFRIYKKEVFEALLMNVKSRGYAYQMEIICLAEKNNFKIGEYPIIFYERVFGESKMGIFEMFYFLYILCYLFFRVK